jgi:predicted nucleotidyltransferase
MVAENGTGSNIATYLSEQTDVVVAYLFGSVARGPATARSDIDLALLLDTRLGPEVLVERQLALMVALDTYVDRDLQVTLLNSAPPMLDFYRQRLLRQLQKGERREPSEQRVTRALEAAERVHQRFTDTAEDRARHLPGK